MRKENATAIAVTLDTGMRIGDVLKIKKTDIDGNTISYIAEKTDKIGKATVTDDTVKKLNEVARESKTEYVFSGTRENKHRTRATVWRDFRKSADKLKLPVHVSPHSARKTYAVGVFRAEGIERVKERLQHDKLGTTVVYALADTLRNEAEKRKQETSGGVLSPEEAKTAYSVGSYIADVIVEKLLKSKLLPRHL